MRLTDLLNESAVLLDPPLAGKSDLFQALEAVLRRSAPGVPAGEIAAALDARERAGATFLGDGVAVPHAFVPGLDGVHLALCRPREPLPYASDGRRAALALAVVAPPGDMGRHVRVLAGIARLFLVPDMRQRLSAATSASEVLDLIASADAAPEVSA